MTAFDDTSLDHRVGEARYVQTVFDALPFIVVAFEGDDLRIAATSAAYRAFVGREFALGTPMREAFPETVGQQVMEIFEHCYATGEPASLRDFRVAIDRPDLGDPIELVIDFSVYPRRGPDGQVTGVISQVTDVSERARERQAAQARTAAAQRRYEQARDGLAELQRELLPAGLPVLPGLEIAASYLLADADTAAGGDWFDAVALPDGRVALTVGDVVGHGVRASAVMGRLQALLSERLLETADVAAALRAVDRMATRTPGARAATVCAMIMDPVDGSLTYCTAGHPPPLVVTTNGPRYLTPTHSGPLGTGSEFRPEHDTLGPDDLLLLYTDGILERPGRDLAGTPVELAETAAAVTAGRALSSPEPTVVERVCTQTLEILTRFTGHTDDITLLAAQRRVPQPSLTLRVIDEPLLLADVRTAVGDWLERLGAAEDDVTALQHAVGELLANAVEHAHPDDADAHPIDIAFTLTDNGVARGSVADSGRWREPRPSPDRGMGLQIVTGLVDDLHLDRAAAGTTATLTRQLSRPARLLTDADLTSGRPAPGRAGSPDPFLVLDQPQARSPRLRVDGPLDTATVTAFEHAVREGSASGTRSLTLDLTGVSLLASVAVAALYRLTREHTAHDTRLHLYAPTGSPADIILTLVSLDHHTRDPDEQTPESGPEPTS